MTTTGQRKWLCSLLPWSGISFSSICIGGNPKSEKFTRYSSKCKKSLSGSTRENPGTDQAATGSGNDRDQPYPPYMATVFPDWQPKVSSSLAGMTAKTRVKTNEKMRWPLQWQIQAGRGRSQKIWIQ
jgi:hypothetical protein